MAGVEDISRSIRVVPFCHAPPHGKSLGLFLIISAISHLPGSGRNPKALSGFAALDGCRSPVDPVHRERLTLADAVARPRSSPAILPTPTQPANFRLIIGSCWKPSKALRISSPLLICTSGKIPEFSATRCQGSGRRSVPLCSFKADSKEISARVRF